MATPNVFSGSLISRATTDQQNNSRATFVTALTASTALTPAQVFNGIVTSSGGAFTATLPTAATIGAALFGNLVVGDTIELVINGLDANVVTLAVAAGITNPNANANALLTIIANGNFARFFLRCTVAPTNAAGLNTAFVVYRAG